MTTYYDKRGEPLTWAEWEVLWRQPEYPKVGSTTTTKSQEVKTHWHGHDHQSSPTLEIFETQVRDEDGDFLEGKSYATEAQALKGHADLVEKHGGEKP